MNSILIVPLPVLIVAGFFTGTALAFGWNYRFHSFFGDESNDEHVEGV